MFEGKEYIYEVYKTGSFSKAAEKLYITQPSLSAMVKKVERKLGAPIFDRSTVPPRLTECGERYIRCVERLMDMENEFDNYLNDLESLRIGHLAVGGTNLFTSYVLPPLLQRFMKQFPGVEMNLVESNTKQLEQLLFSGSLDLVIDNYPFPGEIYERRWFKTEHLLLAVPKAIISDKAETFKDSILSSEDIRNDRHLLDTVRPVDLSLFAEAPFLLLRHGNDTRERSDILLNEAGIRHPRILLNLDQQMTAYHLACRGMGIAFVTDTLIKNVPSDSRILFFRTGGSVNCRHIYFYYKRSRYLTRAMEEFLKLLPKEEDAKKEACPGSCDPKADS